ITQLSASGEEEIVNTRAEYSRRRRFPVNWFDAGPVNARNSDNVPQKLAIYRDRAIVRDPATQQTFFLFDVLDGNDQTLKDRVYLNQSAECLYLMISTTFIGGAPALNAIPTGNVGDTDNDGLLEILDGWGQPIGFLRNAVGYTDVGKVLNERVSGLETVEDIDVLQGDYAHYVDQTANSVALAWVSDPEVTPKRTTPWSMRPLILSAGPDGEFGITFDPIDANGVLLGDYRATASAWNWPVSQAYMGPLVAGNHGASSIPFPDPYFRVFVNGNGGSSGNFAGFLPGQFFGDDPAEEVQDNVSNFQLQVDQ
ncbi:MAG: hypothetical protein AAF989_15595, partial [Planctomycetota bacterium]